MDSRERPKKQSSTSEPQEPNPEATSPPDYDLAALFTLLVRQPPKDHDFRTCPICQEFGITEI